RVVGHLVAPCHVGEVREERLRSRIAVEQPRLDSERHAEEPARSRRIDDAARRNAKGPPMAMAAKNWLAARTPVERVELDLVDVFDAAGDRLAHQKRIDV